MISGVSLAVCLFDVTSLGINLSMAWLSWPCLSRSGLNVNPILYIEFRYSFGAYSVYILNVISQWNREMNKQVAWFDGQIGVKWSRHIACGHCWLNGVSRQGNIIVRFRTCIGYHLTGAAALSAFLCIRNVITSPWSDIVAYGIVVLLTLLSTGIPCVALFTNTNWSFLLFVDQKSPYRNSFLLKWIGVGI